MADPGFPRGGAPTPERGANLLSPPANEVWGKVICLQVSVYPQGGAIPACITGDIPACLAAGLGGGLKAHTQGGSGGGSFPGPQPRGKLRGIWSRSTAKGEIEGESGPGPQPRGKLEGSGPGGAWSGEGVPGPGGCLLEGCLVLGGCLLLGCLVETPSDGYCCGGTHPTEMHSCLA